MIKAVFIDVDDTLLDFDESAKMSMCIAAEEMGSVKQIPITTDTIIPPRMGLSTTFWLTMLPIQVINLDM